jgi:hypothetical protein
MPPARVSAMNARPWSNTELETLAQYQWDSDLDMAHILSRSALDVRTKRADLGLQHGKALDALSKQDEMAPTTARGRRRHHEVENDRIS